MKCEDCNFKTWKVQNSGSIISHFIVSPIRFECVRALAPVSCIVLLPVASELPRVVYEHGWIVGTEKKNWTMKSKCREEYKLHCIFVVGLFTIETVVWTTHLLFFHFRDYCYFRLLVPGSCSGRLFHTHTLSNGRRYKERRGRCRIANATVLLSVKCVPSYSLRFGLYLFSSTWRSLYSLIHALSTKWSLQTI